jgi:alkylhydroperoxidase/carboxymuconolactone decarboxylase family protein YurZ
MSMPEVSPEINRGFVDFYRTVSAEGALDRKTKELIALAVSLSTGCGH